MTSRRFDQVFLRNELRNRPDLIGVEAVVEMRVDAHLRDAFPEALHRGLHPSPYFCDVGLAECLAEFSRSRDL